MAYVPVPKDLTKVKSKFLFGLTANSGKTEHLFRTTGTLIPFETEQNY